MRIIPVIRSWWSRHPMLHPLVAATLVLTIQPATYGKATRLADLAPGEHVVVNYASDGCFAQTRARITLTGTARGVRFTATTREWGFRSPTRTGELTHSQAAALDVTTDRFRAPRRGEWCTTETRVELSHTVAGLPVSREVYRSRSCASNPGAMSFWELLPYRD